MPLLPEIAEAADIDEIPAMAKFLAMTIVVQRVLSLPGVEMWLKEYMPWLSAEGYHGRHRKEDQVNED